MFNIVKLVNNWSLKWMWLLFQKLLQLCTKFTQNTSQQFREIPFFFFSVRAYFKYGEMTLGLLFLAVFISK